MAVGISGMCCGTVTDYPSSQNAAALGRTINSPRTALRRYIRTPAASTRISRNQSTGSLRRSRRAVNKLSGILDGVTGRVLKDKRERFRREVDKFDMGQDCDPAVAAIFEGV